MVSEILNRVVLLVSGFLVGIDSRLQGINSWLNDESGDVAVGMICGIGGVGKTTLAKIAFKLHYEKFDGFSFLGEVRRKAKQDNKGLVKSQRKLLSDILKEKVEEIYNKDEGTAMIRKAINHRRVLVVLDDVDDNELLAAVIGEWDSLHSKGSKIIITTRQQSLLSPHESYKEFIIEPLDENESLQLFSLHAFEQEYPASVDMENSRYVVGHCDGLPLALEVLGSSLSGDSGLSMDELERKLDAAEKIEGEEELERTLKISYKSLRDPRDKILFLDMACFYIGKKKYHVDKVVEDSELYRALGIQTLIDRHLITVNEDNKLTMHQLLRDMGRKIAQRKYTKGKTHRRIWNSEDALTVLRENIDTDRVRSLILDKQVLNITPTNEENSGIEGFAKLSSLKLLYLNKVKLKRGHKKLAGALRWLWRRASFSNAKLNGGGYKNFPTSLIWLSWHGFPLKFIPNAFTLEELVVLDLRNSSLEYIWKGPKFLPNLKILNLSHSHLLVAFPNCSKLPNLELLILKDCINLVEIDKSIGFLEKVILLNLKDCKKLKKLPREIARMKSLEELLLSGCSELNEIPEELVELDSLRVFDASGTAINQGSSISERSPRFSLAILPHFLTVLRLKDCNLSDDVIPGDLSLLCSLVMLELSGNPIQTLPQSIVSLAWLEFLSLDRCRRLQFLPELPQGLRGLNLVGCKSLEKLKGELWTKKEHVGINGCANLLEIEGLYKLQKMTDIDKIIMDVFHIFSLKALANSFEVEMINCQTQSMLTEKFQMPVLHECGIISFFLPGSEIPSWYWYQTELQLLKFSMPHVQRNQRLTGLNLCVVYAFDSSKIDSFHPFVKDKIDGSFSFVAIITNITKGIKWFYRPAFFAKPETGVNMTWLSHWKFWDQLQGGDEVEVRVIGSFAVRVKMVGIDRVFEEGIQIPTHHVDTSPYEVRPGRLQPVEFRFDHSLRGPVGPRPFDCLTNRSPYEVMPGDNRRGSITPPIYFHLNHYPDDLN